MRISMDQIDNVNFKNFYSILRIVGFLCTVQFSGLYFQIIIKYLKYVDTVIKHKLIFVCNLFVKCNTIMQITHRIERNKLNTQLG